MSLTSYTHSDNIVEDCLLLGVPVGVLLLELGWKAASLLILDLKGVEIGNYCYGSMRGEIEEKINGVRGWWKVEREEHDLNLPRDDRTARPRGLYCC